MEGIKGYYNGLADLLELGDYADDAAIKQALQPGMQEYEGVVNDVYLGFDDKTFIDGGDWVPDADYDPTTRGWYEEGSKTDKVIFGTPDIMSDTFPAARFVQLVSTSIFFMALLLVSAIWIVFLDFRLYRDQDYITSRIRLIMAPFSSPM